MHSIWSPPLVFDNTESQDTVVIDAKVTATVCRFSNITLSDDDEPIRTSYFHGEENSITFSRLYDTSFLCSINMEWYPFDLQQCELYFQLFGSTSNYVQMIPKEILYSDEKNLPKYSIKSWKFFLKEENSKQFIAGTLLNKKNLTNCHAFSLDSDEKTPN